MATTLLPPKTIAPARNGGFGSRGGFWNDGFGGPGGEPHREPLPWSVPARAYRTGMWMAMAAIVMLFAAFTSALIVRQGISTDWTPTALPRILYLNTAVLLASSLTLQLSRRSLRANSGGQFALWLYVTIALGFGFVAGQLAAWRELAYQGVYLSTNPSSSFFYLLTAAHGLHLLGGIAALCYLVVNSRKLAAKIRKSVAVDVVALYWHFMDGLWLYVLILLMVRL